MRMWMVPPQILCRQHLLGEHRELHTLAGCLKRQLNLSCRNSLSAQDIILQIPALYDRHELLVQEMAKRHFIHKSNLQTVDYTYLSMCVLNLKVDITTSLRELYRRCPNCKNNIQQLARVPQNGLI